jgi:hypothetical protein
MRFLKLLVGALAVGAIAVAFRDLRTGRWLKPQLPGEEEEEAAAEREEPVLGYDGMDRDTLVDWLRDAALDEETLVRIRRYEAANQNREPVLAAVADLLG